MDRASKQNKYTETELHQLFHKECLLFYSSLETFQVSVCVWCVRRSDLQTNNYLLNAFQVSCSNSVTLASREYKEVKILAKNRRRQIRKADVKLNNKVAASLQDYNSSCTVGDMSRLLSHMNHYTVCVLNSNMLDKISVIQTNVFSAKCVHIINILCRLSTIRGTELWHKIYYIAILSEIIFIQAKLISDAKE